MNLIKSFNDVAVSFNQAGFLNATQIAKHFGKQPRDYLKTEQTQQYIVALAEHLSSKTKILVEYNQLVTVKNGGSQRGTWLHPKLAIHFARWLDPKFAVWCDEQIEQIMSGNAPQAPLKLEPAQPALPNGSKVLSATDVRRLRTLFQHLPYMLAYFHRTSPAVLRLNDHIVHRTHDRFGDGFLSASLLAKSLNIPMKTSSEVIHELYK